MHRKKLITRRAVLKTLAMSVPIVGLGGGRLPQREGGLRGVIFSERTLSSS